MQHPYIPNSAPATQQAMLGELGADSIDELYASIPASLRFEGPLDLPGSKSEQELLRHVGGILDRNETCAEAISFLGGGCWNHYVPAVCDEIARRSEFVTAYVGGPHSNLGSLQAQFEYQSMLGELVGMQVVGSPTYDWGTAAVNSLLMTARLTGRNEVIVPATMSPVRLSQLGAATGDRLQVRTCGYDAETGALDLDDLDRLLSTETAGIYVEVPSYLGGIEPALPEVGDRAHEVGAYYVVGVDPSSLGVLEAPSRYGADIVCGDLQPLGIRMQYGGGLAGFVATRDEPELVAEYPHILISMMPTTRDGEYAFSWVNFDDMHYVRREHSQDFTGTTQVLWGIVAGAYLALMGPEGMRELGEGILQRSAYAVTRLSELAGVTGSHFQTVNFKEFVVNFDATGMTVPDINAALLERGIFGGTDLSGDFPELGNSALYCVTEASSKQDIDDLVDVLEEITS